MGKVEKLLNDGIIRPSHSSYNSPLWIAPKKIDASGQKKFRMVINYRKIISKTICDTYPIPEPDTAAILANLGKNIFSKLLT